MAERLWIGAMRVGPIETNCYFLRDGEKGEELVLVDPGDDAKRILAAIKDMDVRLTAILLTHAHYDHIMAVNEMKEAYPDTPVLILDRERGMVENPSFNASFFDREYVIHPDRYLTDGEVLTLLGRSIQVLASPGHTAGSCCYYLKEDGVLFSGDTIFRQSYGRYDLPTGSREALMDSLEELLTTLPETTVVYPGHGRETTIGYEKQIEGFT